MKSRLRLVVFIFSVIGLISWSLVSAHATNAAESFKYDSKLVAQLRLTAGLQPLHIVPDLQVDSVIDSGLSAIEHAIIKSALLALPPNQRSQGIIVQTVDGRIHASSRALLAFENREQIRHLGAARTVGTFERYKSPGLAENFGFAAVCSQQSVGGYTTGPFRRVYIGCPNSTQQITDFNGTHCQISDYLNTANDLHGVYDGAYGVNGGGGKLDAGLVYTRSSQADAGQWQVEILTGSHLPIYGSVIPCGQGVYDTVLTLNVVNPNVNQFTFSTNFTGPKMSAQYPNSVFASNGSNFIFRRLTAIAQAPENFKSTEWFGFVDNGSNGPDLSTPDIGFTYSAVCCDALKHVVTFVGGASANAYADRNPQQMTNNVIDIICGHYPGYWLAPGNFSTTKALILATLTLRVSSHTRIVTAADEQRAYPGGPWPYNCVQLLTIAPDLLSPAARVDREI